MKLFIDCEWNDYQGELISMALCPEDNTLPSFYEVIDFRNPTRWVKNNVCPVLNKTAVPKWVFQKNLSEYLAHFPDIQIIADWPEDIAHFCQALITAPGQSMWFPPITFSIEDISCEFAIPHNALADAEALRASYRKIKHDR